MAKLSTEILHSSDNDKILHENANEKILHENANMFLIKVWQPDCELVVNSVFEGTDEQCLKQCKKLITMHNAQRATYEIYTPTKPKTN